MPVPAWGVLPVTTRNVVSETALFVGLTSASAAPTLAAKLTTPVWVAWITIVALALAPGPSAPSAQETGPPPEQPPGAVADTIVMPAGGVAVITTPLAPWLPAFVAVSV